MVIKTNDLSESDIAKMLGISPALIFYAIQLKDTTLAKYFPPIPDYEYEIGMQRKYSDKSIEMFREFFDSIKKDKMRKKIWNEWTRRIYNNKNIFGGLY